MISSFKTALVEGADRCGLILFWIFVSATATAGAVSVDQNTSDWLSTILLGLGLVLLLLEIKITSLGILGFLGSSLLVTAAVIILRDGTPFWGVPAGWIIPVIALVIVLTGVLAWLAVQAQKEKVVLGYEGFIGEIAEVSEALKPEGTVFFNGTYWKAVCAVPVAVGQKVRVLAGTG